jgi:methyl-accepting chemotaxis protein
VGVLYVGIKQENVTSLRKAIMDMTIGESGYVIVIDSTGKYIISHKGEKDGEDALSVTDINGKPLFKDIIATATRLEPRQIGSLSFTVPDGTATRLTYDARFVYFEPWDWIIVAQGNKDDFIKVSKILRSIGNKGNITIAVVGIAIMILSGLIWYFVANSITRPISIAASGLKEIAQGEGDLTKRLEVKTNDEVGELVTWFNSFIANLQTMILNISGNSETIGKSTNVVNTLNSKINTRLKTISESFGIVSDSCSKTSDNMNAVSAAMEQATTSVETVAAAAEEMSSAVDEIAKNTASARQTTDQTVDLARSISIDVEDLGKAASEIDQVLVAITDISEQTNLLALNATIEAARAGEAGKGFAVVASEIKNLAQQTTDATLEIRSKIESVQLASRRTIERIGEVTQVIEVSSGVVNSIASAVEEQSAATREIAKSATETSLGIVEVNKNVAESTAQLDIIARNITVERKSIEDVAFSTVEAEINSTETNKMANELHVMANRFYTGDKKIEIGEIKIAHLAWRTTLEAVIQGIVIMQPEEVTSHQQCDLGQWYFGEGRVLSSYPEYDEIGVWHEKVHDVARNVVTLCAKGENEKAVPLLKDFKEARVNLFRLLDSLYLK